MKKPGIFHTVLIVILATLALSLGVNILRTIDIEDHEVVSREWGLDIQELKTNPKIKNIFDNVTKVNIEPALDNLNAQAWIKKLHVPFAVNQSGSFYADVLVIPEDDDQGRAILVQMSFFDLGTGNLVAEITRRYQY